MQSKIKTAKPAAKASEAKAAQPKAQAAEKPAITESQINALFRMLHDCDSVPVKIGGNRGRNSSEPLGGEHPRVGFGPRGAAMLVFLAIASGTEIKPGNKIPRFTKIGETEIHGETGCGRNVLRGRRDKKSGKTVQAVTLDSDDSGDAFKLTANAAAEIALIAPGKIKAFREAFAKLS